MQVSGYLCALIACTGLTLSMPAGNQTRLESGNHVPLLLLVSFDGFRADYLKKYSFPNLEKFFSEGVLVHELTNVFTTKTYPNHYSLVTGLYAESHGMLASIMYDPVSKKTFSVQNDSDPFWWDEATPIWVSVEESGYKAAAAMWPGTDVSIQNHTLKYQFEYDPKVTFQEFFFLHISQKIMQVNTKCSASLWHGGHRRPYSDMKRHRGDCLWDSHRPPGFHPKYLKLCSEDERHNSTVYKNLSSCHGHMKAYLKDNVPDRLHYKNNGRIQPILLVADEGWTIVKNGKLPRMGDHGYDNALPSMHPFLAAHGPAFRKGYKMSSFNSVDLYPLMCHLVGVPPMPNNGSFSHVRCALVNEQCGELALAVGLVIGVLIILTTFTCLFKLMKNRDASSPRPFARLELEDDADDEPLLE
uniref:bis(5'-adenosyl)-triphosphatase n=1 Tax=Cyprinus carpio TaxID=7962 RepID=A0A8C1ZEC0_CYPCA